MTTHSLTKVSGVRNFRVNTEDVSRNNMVQKRGMQFKIEIPLSPEKVQNRKSTKSVLDRQQAVNQFNNIQVPPKQHGSQGTRGRPRKTFTSLKSDISRALPVSNNDRSKDTDVNDISRAFHQNTAQETLSKPAMHQINTDTVTSLMPETFDEGVRDTEHNWQRNLSLNNKMSLVAKTLGSSTFTRHSLESTSIDTMTNPTGKDDDRSLVPTSEIQGTFSLRTNGLNHKFKSSGSTILNHNKNINNDFQTTRDATIAEINDTTSSGESESEFEDGVVLLRQFREPTPNEPQPKASASRKNNNMLLQSQLHFPTISPLNRLVTGRNNAQPPQTHRPPPSHNMSAAFIPTPTASSLPSQSSSKSNKYYSQLPSCAQPTNRTQRRLTTSSDSESEDDLVKSETVLKRFQSPPAKSLKTATVLRQLPNNPVKDHCSVQLSTLKPSPSQTKATLPPLLTKPAVTSRKRSMTMPFPTGKPIIRTKSLTKQLLPSEERSDESRKRKRKVLRGSAQYKRVANDEAEWKP